MALRGQVSCPNLDQIDWERKKEEEKERENGRERESVDFREISSTFSLKFPAIGPLDSGDARSKVAPHDMDYAWVPDLGSFDNSEKVGVFLLLALLFA